MPPVKKQNENSGQMLIALIIVIVIIGSVLFSGGFSPYKVKPSYEPIAGTPVLPAQGGPRNNLQLQTFSFQTPTPPLVTPTPVANMCTEDTCMSPEGGVNCTCGPMQEFYACTPQTCDYGCTPNSSGQYWFCYGKPVIYLYPVVKTYVNVRIETSGEIVASDPAYPSGGWKNILAEPNGNLTYNNKNYSELFYESKVKNSYLAENGIVITRSALETKLAEIIDQLGLNKKEQLEFLDFWIPKLKALNSPFILFSVIDKGTKEANDHIVMVPEPDTRIEFIAYFKPLDFPISIKPLVLPQRPERLGFTSVEWGGTIDSSPWILR